jgi:hypothetical protein
VGEERRKLDRMNSKAREHAMSIAKESPGCARRREEQTIEKKASAGKPKTKEVSLYSKIWHTNSILPAQYWDEHRRLIRRN